MTTFLIIVLLVLFVPLARGIFVLVLMLPLLILAAIVAFIDKVDEK